MHTEQCIFVYLEIHMNIHKYIHTYVWVPTINKIKVAMNLKQNKMRYMGGFEEGKGKGKIL